jgi:hypothetical protein
MDYAYCIGDYLPVIFNTIDIFMGECGEMAGFRIPIQFLISQTNIPGSFVKPVKK